MSFGVLFFGAVGRGEVGLWRREQRGGGIGVEVGVGREGGGVECGWKRAGMEKGWEERSAEHSLFKTWLTISLSLSLLPSPSLPPPFSSSHASPRLSRLSPPSSLTHPCASQPPLFSPSSLSPSSLSLSPLLPARPPHPTGSPNRLLPRTVQHIPKPPSPEV